MICSLFHLFILHLCSGASFAAVINMNVTSESTMNDLDGIICYCEGCPHGKEDTVNYCVLAPGGQCFSAVEEIYNVERNVLETQRTFGCFSDSQQALLQCKGDLIPAHYGRTIQCCNFTDLCNKDLLPSLIHHDTPSFMNMHFIRTHAFIISSATIVLLGLIVILASFLRNWKVISKKFFVRKGSSGHMLPKSERILQDTMSTTGSGVGKPLLVQTTISRQFSRNYCLGKGRFTEVFVGDWKASKIVEKVFSSRSEDRWVREKTVYEIALLRHENVLGYIAADLLKSGLRAIYMDYHRLGSLDEYLKRVSLNQLEFLTLASSAANGIHQLHTEVSGTERRPAVAHCDITSRNFLINANKECVISNFEIAIMNLSTEDTLRDEPDLMLGTPRYMAPEVVNGTIDDSSFEALKKADIYSLGLVFYEIFQRCVSTEDTSLCEDHSLPFSHLLPECPSWDDMRALHSMKKPKEELLFVPTRWEDDKFLRLCVPTLRECLNEHPKSRPAALRIRKKMDEIGKMYWS